MDEGLIRTLAKAESRSQAPGQEIAYVASVRAIREGGCLPLAEGLLIERGIATGVISTPGPAPLIEVALMKNRLASGNRVADPAVITREVRRVGVLGAGQMGAGIAAVHVHAGLPLVMVDVNATVIDAGAKRVADVLKSGVRNNRATNEDVVRDLSRLKASTSTEVLCDCDVIIEAITEDEELKKSSFSALGGLAGERSILASNTSTIPISRMAQASLRPDRFAGMHFFHPVHRMELVEVIRGELTSDETVATLVALAQKLGKTPIVVRDCPGFLVTRVLYPYWSQAIELLREGASMDQIDEVAVRFGMPAGPVAVLDLVGLDTVLAISKVMAAGYPGRVEVSPLLEEMVKKGLLGQKAGAGFRNFHDKTARPVSERTCVNLLTSLQLASVAPGEQEIEDRLFLPMLLEAIRTLEDGIVRDPDDVDIGVMLGFGFPAFRCGVLGWCDAEGAGGILSRLARYQAAGALFQPPETLTWMARERKSFRPRQPFRSGH
jgi:3-hydroxyacyl-CoA dehydrogenase